jgi:hypothetical protein
MMPLCRWVCTGFEQGAPEHGDWTVTQDPKPQDLDVDHVRRLLERLERGLDPDAIDPVDARLEDQQAAAKRSAEPVEDMGHREMVAANRSSPTRAPVAGRVVLAAVSIAAIGGGTALVMSRATNDSGAEPARIERPSAPTTEASPVEQGRAVAAIANTGRDAEPEGEKSSRGAPPEVSTTDARLAALPNSEPTAAAPPPSATSPATLPSPRPTAQEGPVASAALLARASAELQAGRVAMARTLLQDALRDEPANADLVWALARAYSPAVLAGIANADADADAARTERLLRRWHELSVSQGLISPDVPLDRILMSMQRDADR